jgi:hypothetical protein
MKEPNKIITEQDYKNACNVISDYSKQLKNHYLEVKLKNRSLKKITELDDYDYSEISVRLYNILKWKFTDIKLCDITKEEFFKARNAGVNTYKELCNFINVTDLK